MNFKRSNYTIPRVLNYVKVTVVLCKRLVKLCYKMPLYKRLAKHFFNFFFCKKKKCVISLTPFTDHNTFSVNIFRRSNLYHVEENGNLRSFS